MWSATAAAVTIYSVGSVSWRACLEKGCLAGLPRCFAWKTALTSWKAALSAVRVYRVTQVCPGPRECVWHASVYVCAFGGMDGEVSEAGWLAAGWRAGGQEWVGGGLRGVGMASLFTATPPHLAAVVLWLPVCVFVVVCVFVCGWQDGERME
ncbi:hypothetical protein E2C01_082650 [Portunus trituberculatus]|uniref:Uncharacterized protein n=1 Tax=Portunus trituberculatus TaxID=210409 RepID=A0A5B7J2A8_PORTR|nr:hypothetical protein [Portunus trituberculatus]